MIRLHETTTVEREARDCFRYLADFSTAEQWDPGVYRAEKRTPGPPAPGSAFALTLSSGGRRVPMTYTLEELRPDTLIVLKGEGDGFSADDRITLESVAPGRTRIEYEAVLTFSGAAGRAEALLRPWLKGVGRKAVAGMTRALTPSPAPSPGALANLGHRLVLPAAWSFTERGYLAMSDKGLSEFIDDRIWVITGPTSGLGLATGCLLARLGARLVLVGRGPERLAEAAAAIDALSGCGPERIRAFEAELSLARECRRVAAEITAAHPAIDGLVHNAGALFAEREETEEGHERALAINLVAPWVLTRGLLPAMRARGARVISVASGGMYLQPLRLDDLQYRKGRYDGSVAYARAKRALVALNEHWAETIPDVDFHSMHPGWAATPGVARSLPKFDRRMKKWLRDSRMGADTIVWLATTAALAGRSGQFWFDRKPRPTAVIPGTAVSARQRAELATWLGEHPG